MQTVHAVAAVVGDVVAAALEPAACTDPLLS